MRTYLVAGLKPVQSLKSSRRVSACDPILCLEGLDHKNLGVLCVSAVNPDLTPSLWLQHLLHLRKIDLSLAVFFELQN